MKDKNKTGTAICRKTRCCFLFFCLNNSFYPVIRVSSRFIKYGKERFEARLKMIFNYFRLYMRGNRVRCIICPSGALAYAYCLENMLNLSFWFVFLKKTLDKREMKVYFNMWLARANYILCRVVSCGLLELTVICHLIIFDRNEWKRGCFK